MGAEVVAAQSLSPDSGSRRRPTHSQRRSRQQLALCAALARCEELAAVLEAVTLEPHGASSGLVARLRAMVPGYVAQQAAADAGEPARSSADLVHPDLHVLAGSARHLFAADLDFSEVTPTLARQKQRKARAEPLASPPKQQVHSEAYIHALVSKLDMLCISFESMDARLSSLERLPSELAGRGLPVIHWQQPRGV